MTSWLHGPILEPGLDLWESVASALAEWTPQLAAIVDPMSGVSVSAFDLLSRIEVAAGTLLAAGAEPGDRVIIDLDRSIEEVVFVLACVRQGLAYVGTAADEPVSAHSAVVHDSSPVAVVTHRPNGWDLPTINPQPEDSISTPSSASSDVCYISYTSGTTGSRKGVEAPRSGVDRLMRGAEYCSIRRGDRILRFAPLAFDASTFEIFVGLWRRATLVIGPTGPLDINALANFIVDQKIDVCWLTSGLFSSLVDYRPESFAKLRQVLTGGDRVAASAINDLLGRFPHLSVVNGYGPTEATTFATTRSFAFADLPLTTVPIGRPVGDTSVGISDEGEILIAGGGLAVGYRNDPDLTAERFRVIDGRRVYLTGDLGTIVDGELQFLGRRDRQLKIHGFRVEPSAVDEVLRRERLVADSWSFGLQGSEGTELVCAFVASPGLSHAFSNLRQRLMDGGLPVYAVPRRFIEVSVIPLTVNGKVDQAALIAEAAFGEHRADPEAETDSSDLTKSVRHTWSVALGSNDFDDHSGFFDSGGDSLRLAKVHAMLQGLFPEIDLKLVDLLRYPSVAEQVLALREKYESIGRHNL